MVIYERLLAKNGLDRQLDKAMEELSELITAIAKYKHGKDNVKHIAEELADVEIMCEQVQTFLSIPRETIDANKKYKLARTAMRECLNCMYEEDKHCIIDGEYSVGGCDRKEDVKIKSIFKEVKIDE